MRLSQTNRTNGLVCFLTTGLLLGGLASTRAQAPEAGRSDTRAAQIATQQQEKAPQAKPYEPDKAEIWVKKLEEQREPDGADAGAGRTPHDPGCIRQGAGERDQHGASVLGEARRRVLATTGEWLDPGRLRAATGRTVRSA
jgi:hypothetical protein